MDDLARFARTRRLAVAVVAGVIVVVVAALYILSGSGRGPLTAVPNASASTPSESVSPSPSSSPSPDPSPAESPTSTDGSTLSICCVVVDQVTETTARVTWTASAKATGQVELGTTTAYGSTSILEPSYNYETHVQVIEGLLPGSPYHFRAHSVDQEGNEAYSDDQTFTTLGASPPPAGACFGSCFGGDTLANTRVGYKGFQVAYSFKATSARLASIRVYWQDGSGYGAGTGGTMEATIRPTSGGLPASTVLGSATFPGETAPGRLVTYADQPSLTPGSLYWVVFRNVDRRPTVNYTSANATTQDRSSADRQRTRQPGTPDDELAVYYHDGSTWIRRSGQTAIIDIGYADGSHSGQGYVEFWVHGGEHAPIGGRRQVRERLTNPTARTVSTMAARVERVSGSGPLTISLYSGATLLAEGTVPASDVERSPVGTDGGLTWAVVDLPTPVALPAGPATFVLTAPSGTAYSTFGIRKGGFIGYTAGATYFAYGSAQESGDGGTSWTDLNDIARGSDLQFYLR